MGGEDDGTRVLRINSDWSDEEAEASEGDVSTNTVDYADNEHLVPEQVSYGFGRSDNEEWRVGTTGWFASACLIVNAALGAGLLNFPEAFHQAGGVFVAILVQLCLMFFIVPALVVLAYSSDLKGTKTLQEVLSSTWGRGGSIFTSICVAVYCFGTCITFLIIIGDQFDRVFASVSGPTFCDTWYMDRNFTIISTSLVFILPFCFSKKIDFLKHVSSVGVVAIFYVLFLFITQYFKGNYLPGPIKTKPDSWMDIWTVIPIICFSYQCHVSIIPIYACMKTRNLRSFLKSSSLAIIVCLFTYSVGATFAYLSFGGNVKNDVLENYDANNWSVLLAIFAVAIKTYTTYPILLFCGR